MDGVRTAGLLPCRQAVGGRGRWAAVGHRSGPRGRRRCSPPWC